MIVRHALRNAALPLITVVGLQFGTLLGGAIVTETIFSWPGIGLLSIQAVQARDLPLVRALIAVVAVMFILVNLVTNLRRTAEAAQSAGEAAMSGSPRGTTDEIAGMPDEILAAQRPAGAGIGAVFLLRSADRREVCACSSFLVLNLVVALISRPLLATSDPELRKSLPMRCCLRPGWRTCSSVHPLGTDQLGRDILLRVIYGAQSSLALGIIAVAGSATVGSLAGVTAAQGGVLADETIMRIADIQLSIPFFLLAIAALAIVGGSAVNMVIILIVSGWVPYARVVRSELLFIQETEFITAARSIGARSLRDRVEISPACDAQPDAS